MNLLSGTAQPKTRASTSAICAQPTSVIASPLYSEFFGMDQCVEEVQAEPDGDDQSDDRLTHGARLLKPPQGEGVNAHQRQNRASERHKRDIEHDCFLAGASPTAKRRKLSIPNRGRRRKDSIKLCGDA